MIHAPLRIQPGPAAQSYLMCLLTSLVISNIDTLFLPPNTGRSLSSALIMRRSFWSWQPLRLMYCQSFFVISVRGIGLLPTTAPSAASGCIGFMNAGFGARLAPLRLAPRDALRALPRAFFAPPRFAPPRLAPPRFAAFFVAILSPGRWNGVRFSL